MPTAEQVAPDTGRRPSEGYDRQPLAWIGDHIRPASGHVRHIGPLKPQAGEPQLTKTSHNAFTTTNLQQLLTQQGITEVIVCGIRTEQCCETTARVAFDLGYHVTFVTEATATSPIAQHDAPTGQTVEQLLADPRTPPASMPGEMAREPLTPQEAQVARLAREGLSNPEIAARLFITPEYRQVPPEQSVHKAWHYHARPAAPRLPASVASYLAVTRAGIRPASKYVL